MQFRHPEDLYLFLALIKAIYLNALCALTILYDLIVMEIGNIDTRQINFCDRLCVVHTRGRVQ